MAERKKRIKKKPHKPAMLPKIKQGFSKIGTLNIVLIIVGLFFFWFNWQMLELFRLYGTLPETYACAVVTATIGECGICGWIRTTKDRKREHDWENEKKPEDSTPPAAENESKEDEPCG